MSSALIQALIALVGLGGVGGTILAFKKLPAEASSAAVNQASQTLDMMKSLNDEMVEALGRARITIDQCHSRISELEAMQRNADSIIKQLREMIHGMRIMEDDVNFPPKGGPGPV